MRKKIILVLVLVLLLSLGALAGCIWIIFKGGYIDKGGNAEEILDTSKNISATSNIYDEMGASGDVGDEIYDYVMSIEKTDSSVDAELNTNNSGESLGKRSETFSEDTSAAPFDATVNLAITEEELKNTRNYDIPYYITVNCEQCITIIYIRDENGNFTLPYMAFICSPGGIEHGTYEGIFNISDKYDWRQMIDGSYAQYVSRINDMILFHSVPYFSMNKGNLEYEEYNLLGERGSLGCVRLSALDAKWIYDNCKAGTVVEIYYDNEKEEPLSKPDAIKIDENSENRGWDPTDPDKNNPWWD